MSGTPVAAFDTSGIRDIVEHGYNGYLAKAYDAAELAAGVEWCIAKGQAMRENSREKACRDFGERDIVRKHVAAYERIACYR